MRGAVLLVAITALCAAQRLPDFAGTWVMKSEGQAIFKLTLSVERGLLTGSLTKPEGLTIDQDGVISGIKPKPVTMPVRKAALKSGRLSLRIDDGAFTMTLDGLGVATLEMAGLRPWKVERLATGESVTLATSVPERGYLPEVRALRERLKAMVKEDQDVRMAFDGSRMADDDEKNRPEVLRIFEQFGWPPSSLIGRDAGHDFWLLVQHQTPEIQRRLLPELEKAAKAGQASMSDYAYLYDRVQVGLGKPQHWGTQVKCANGKPVLDPVDDRAGLAQRRKELYMLPIADYLKADYLVKLCAQK